MDSVWLVDENDCIRDPFSAGGLMRPNTPDINSIVVDPQPDPRIGDGYQAEIPVMLTESEFIKFLMNHTDSEVSVGLPLPVKWVHNQRDIIRKDRGASPGKHVGNSCLRETTKLMNMMQGDFVPEVKTMDLTAEPLDAIVRNGSCKRDNCCLVPYSSTEPWTDTEVKGFILGLFIFGKNFMKIRRFMGNKEMGELLEFYYGDFYRSCEYQRWSGLRKRKGRKYVTGEKLFTGWRQQKLLSRLLQHVPKEFQNTLLQVSKSFTEGRSSIEEYLFSIKSIVGFPTLVQAVGVGKGKEDLIKLTSKPAKRKRLLAISPCTQNGNTCSSLEPGDIIKLLTRGCRMSKARSKDIFWNGVWPHLLAKGWHSEQPKIQGFSSSDDNLVFLIPGVEKFSSDKLIKGYHYFDSVRDVLSKVVSEPNLLEFGVEENKDGSSEEKNACMQEEESDFDEFLDQHHQRYLLKPRPFTDSSDHMKFTVVDTSAMHGGKATKVRELKHMPAEKEKDTSLFDDPLDQIKLADDNILYTGNDAKSGCTTANCREVSTLGDLTHKKTQCHNSNYQTQKNDNDNKLERILKQPFCPREKSGLLNAAPLIKRRRLAACSNAETKQVTELSSQPLELDKMEPSKSLTLSAAIWNPSFTIHHHENPSMKVLPFKEQNESNESILKGNCFGIRASSDEMEKCEVEPKVNSCLPQIPLKSENDNLKRVSKDRQCIEEHVPNLTIGNDKLLPEAVTTCKNGDCEKQHPDLNPRRQSTRNRPMSLRLLESLEDEFVDVPRRENKKVQKQKSSKVLRP